MQGGTANWECRETRPTSCRDYNPHLPWDFLLFFPQNPTTMAGDFFLLWCHLALGCAAMKLLSSVFYYLLCKQICHCSLSLSLTHKHTQGCKKVIVFSTSSHMVFVSFYFYALLPGLCLFFLFFLAQTSAYVFTFIIFDIHSCLSLQQQRNQLLVPTQGSMVQRWQPSHRHRLSMKINIFTYIYVSAWILAITHLN